MNKIKHQLFSIFAAVALFVGSLASSGACLLEYYQPKVPAQLRKKD